jgi:hypothetical protein
MEGGRKRRIYVKEGWANVNEGNTDVSEERMPLDVNGGRTDECERKKEGWI